MPDDRIVIEYLEQVKRVAQIYEKINIYNSQTPSINPTDSQIFGDRKIS